MTSPNLPPTPQSQTIPKVIYGKGVDPAIHADPQQLADTMRDLGVSEQGIADSAVYLDPKSRFQTFGTHYPNSIGKLRFRSIPELQETEGDIIRLSTKMKGKPRSDEGMNVTLVHELEHLAQGDRKDRKVTEGHVAIWGLAAAGAVLGNKLSGKNKAGKALGTLAGAAAGHTLGYMIAPHERQARKRASQGRNRMAQVATTTISRDKK